MSFSNSHIDLCKIKKLTIIEIIVAILVLLACGIYYLPHILNSSEDMKNAKIKSNNAIFTSKILEEFSKDNNVLSSKISKKVIEELNKTTKNPFDKNNNAFTLNKKCVSCTSVEYFDSMKMVTVTSYNSKGELVARTVIKPPSFVEYNKIDN